MFLLNCEWCKVLPVFQAAKVSGTTYELCRECYELEKKRRQFAPKLKK